MKLLKYIALILTLFIASARANNYIAESFAGTTANDWSFVTGAGAGPVLTAAEGIDADGSGWLRLTQDISNQTSFVYYNNAIPTANGLVLKFDFVVWGGKSAQGDGFTLALFDAAVETPSPGGYGGSLGYAQRWSAGGLDGGIVGFGFDTFGNFSLEAENREGGPGKTPNAVAIRGSMGTTRADGYEYVTGTGSLSEFSTPNVSSREVATVHSVRITIPPSKKITIEWKTAADENWTTLINEFQCTLNCPSEVKVGFTGGTGSASANQEIRNLSVTSDPGTTSSGVDLRAYRAADGIYVEFVAYDVEEDGTVQLALMDANSDVVWTGTADVVAGPQAIARFLVPGLERGQTYSFSVRDEVGKVWTASGVGVKGFDAEMVSMSPAGAELSFDSIPGREYDIQWTAGLGGSWDTVGTATASEGEATTVVVPYPAGNNAAGFFRIQQK